MCSRTTNWQVVSDKLVPPHSSVKGDAVHVNNNTKSHTKHVYTMTNKLQKTIKEARPPVILDNTLNSSSKQLSTFYRKHGTQCLMLTIEQHPPGACLFNDQRVRLE